MLLKTTAKVAAIMSSGKIGEAAQFYSRELRVENSASVLCLLTDLMASCYYAQHWVDLSYETCNALIQEIEATLSIDLLRHDDPVRQDYVHALSLRETAHGAVDVAVFVTDVVRANEMLQESAAILRSVIVRIGTTVRDPVPMVAERLNVLDCLRELVVMRESGVLSAREFTQAKRKLLE